MKRQNLRIIGIEEGKVQLIGTEKIFNEIIEENFFLPKEEHAMEILEDNRTSNRLDKKNLIT